MTADYRNRLFLDSAICFFIILFDLNIVFDVALLAVTLSAILSAAVIIFKLYNLVSRFMSKAMQGQSYYFREKLLDFSNEIHNVFSLKEQGAELLVLITKAIGCRKAGSVVPGLPMGITMLNSLSLPIRKRP